VDRREYTYRHVCNVAIGALTIAAFLVIVAVLIPLWRKSNIEIVPLPPPRPEGALLFQESGKGDRTDVAGVSQARAELAQRMQAALPPTPAVKRARVAGSVVSRRSNEQATCSRHGLKTVWESQYRWRCRKM
jgi:hypothetical protein